MRSIPSPAKPLGMAILGLAALGAGGAARAQTLVAKPLPAGFRALDVEADHGEALLEHVDGARLPTALATKSLSRLASYYDARPRPISGMSDKDDGAVEVAFEAARGGVPVAGIIAVSIADGGGTVAVVDDRRERLAASLPALQAALQAALPGAPAAIEWQTVPIPGDQGTIRLPTDWRIVGAQGGMVDVAGPRGMASFGIWSPVSTPETAGPMLQMGIRPPLIARYDPQDPSNTFVELFPQIAQGLERLGTPPARLTGIVEKARCDGMPGPAQFLLYDWESGAPPVTKAMRTLILVTLMPNANGFVYYSSSVSAAKESFAQDLPMMLQIWGSWKTSASVLNDRLKKAAESMRETTRIIESETGPGSPAAKAHDVAMEDWAEYMRGTRTVRDAQTGEDHTAWEEGTLDKAIEERNRAEGYERWRVVPARELVGN